MKAGEVMGSLPLNSVLGGHIHSGRIGDTQQLNDNLEHAGLDGQPVRNCGSLRGWSR